MCHQLYYFSDLVNISDWFEFIKYYLLITTIIIETNSPLIPKYFHCLRNQLPVNVNFYFPDSVSPNEFHCFLLSLNYIKKLQIVYLATHLINPIQFSSFIKQLSSCSLSYLALSFSQQDSRTIQSYTTLLSAATSTHYKIGIDITHCELTEMLASTPLFSAQEQFIGSIRLYESKAVFRNLFESRGQIYVSYTFVGRNIHFQNIPKFMTDFGTLYWLRRFRIYYVNTLISDQNMNRKWGLINNKKFKICIQ